MEATNKPSVRSAESLGKVTYETKPNFSNVIAGFILGAGLVVGGLLLTGTMVRQRLFAGENPPQDTPDWRIAIMLTIIGLGVAGGGVSLILFAKSLVGFRLRVCADGFWFTRRGRQSVFAWDEIVLVQETVVEEKLPLVKGPARQLMPTKTTRKYTVVRCDGETFYFDENVIQRTSLLAGPLSTAAKRRDIQWETEQQSR